VAGPDLPAALAEQAKLGNGWVKLVGDWIDRAAGDLAPAFAPDEVWAAVETAHAAGARVATHTFSEEAVATLVRAGVDSVEHGTGLSAELIDELARRGTVLVPTMINIQTFDDIAARAESKFPRYAAHMRELRAGFPAVVRAAHEAGVRIHVGSDAGGGIDHGMAAREMLLLHELAGMAPLDVLRAGSWGAREWLGFPGLVEGGLADLVVYDRDPRVDLRALLEPARIVLRGRVVG
jgi:imidazolonepropionase-like amidohydrolase